MWELIYGLTTIKPREEDPFEGRNNGEEEDDDKKEEIDQGRSNEDKDIPKEKEQEAIQTLVNLPTTDTPTKVLQKMSADAIPL